MNNKILAIIVVVLASALCGTNVFAAGTVRISLDDLTNASGARVVTFEVKID